jgi:hypothetical protein
MYKFKWQGRSAVESNEGFVVERTGSPLTQFMIRYIENGREINYYLENLMPGAIDLITVAEIRSWQPPHETEELSIEKRMLIAERIKAAMAFWGDKSQVV